MANTGGEGRGGGEHIDQNILFVCLKSGFTKLKSLSKYFAERARVEDIPKQNVNKQHYIAVQNHTQWRTLVNRVTLARAKSNVS